MIQFKNIATCMGMEENTARISMAMPAVNRDALQYRAFCIAEFLIKRLTESGRLKELTRQTWGEVRRCHMPTSSSVVAIVQWNRSIQAFPLEIPVKCLVGHKDAIVQHVRKLEREIPNQLLAWRELTKNGMVRFSCPLELLKLMSGSETYGSHEKVLG